MLEIYTGKWSPTPGAPSSLDEVFAGAKEGAEKVDNVNARQRQMEEAYDRRNDAMAAAGLTPPENPWRASLSNPDDQARVRELSANGAVFVPQYLSDKYDRDLQDIEAKNPHLAHVIQATKPPSAEVTEAMQKAEAKRAEIMARRGMLEGKNIPLIGSVPLLGSAAAGVANLAYDPSAMAMMMAGSIRGQMTSPADLAAMMFGPLGTSQAKSLIWNAGRNALNNAGGQALIEPMVQANRAAAGLESGWGVAAENIAGAAGIGAALDAGIRAPVRLARSAMGAKGLGGVVRDAAPDLPPVPAAAPRIDPDIMAKAEAGDIGALRTFAEQAGVLDDPAIKGALDHAELTGSLEDSLTRLRDEMRTRAGVEIDIGETQSTLAKALRSTLDEDAHPIRTPEPIRVAERPLMTADVERLIGERAGELDRLMRHTNAALDRIDPRLAVMVDDAFQAGLPRIVEAVRNAVDAVGEGRSARKLGQAVADEINAMVADLGFDRFSDILALHSGRGSVLETAAAMRRSPDLMDTNVSLQTEHMQVARSLSALDDAAFNMLARGEVDPRVAAYVADHVEPGRQAGVLDTLSRADIRDMAEVAKAVRALEPNPDMGPSPKGIDDPAGPEAKAITDQMESRLEPQVKSAREEVPEIPGEGLGASLVREIMMNAAVKRGQEAQAAILDAIALATRILPEGSKLSVERAEMRDPVTGNLIDAQTNITTGHITLAAYALNPAGRIGHEGVHVLVTTGRLSPDEVKLLAQAAGKLPDVFPEKRRAEYAEAYKDRANLESLLDEEAAAHLIEAFTNKKLEAIDPAASGILDRIKQIIEQIKERLQNWKDNKGWQTADELVADILNGEVAKRQAVETWKRKNDVTALAVRPEAMMAMRDLDMSPEARKSRAEAMGFDTSQVWYHGTTAGAFDAFDTKKANTSSKTGVPDAAVFTDSPGNASTYASNSASSLMYKYEYPTGANVVPVYHKHLHDMVVDAKGEYWGTIEHRGKFYDINELATMAKELEYEGLTVLNVIDTKNTLDAGVPATTRFVFDPDNIRSVNAAFDPRQANSPNLMFALSDTSTGQSMRRDMDALGYRSAALEAARSLKQAKGTPEQMLAQLRSAGVKQAEIEATNLPAFMEGKKSITRDEIVGHLEANRVGLNEVVRSNEGNADSILDMISGRSDTVQNAPTKWSSYSLDPSNPTYRETVLHLPSNRDRFVPERQPLMDEFKALQDKNDARTPSETDRMEALRSQLHDITRTMNEATKSNFTSGHFPEPNIVGHMMTSMTKHEGQPVYTIDQIQSDWGQKLRDGGVRDEAKIAELKARFEDADKALGTFAAKYTDSNGWLTKKPSDDPKWASALQEQERLQAELRTAEASTPGHPLVNTTDQWTVTTLRRALRQAAEADAAYIAIPHGDTVLSYNPGDENGMRGFYGSRTSEGIVPKNLRKMLEKIDKDAKPFKVEGLHTSEFDYTRYRYDTSNRFDPDQTGFTLFPLTDKVKQSVKTEGQVMFAFAGEKARTADLEALNRAKEMEAEGPPRVTTKGAPGYEEYEAHRRRIWDETSAMGQGWFRAPDGRWKWEIDDSKAEVFPGYLELTGKSEHAAPFRDRMAHYDYLQAYPEARDLNVQRMSGAQFPERAGRGAYDPNRNAMWFDGASSDRGRSIALHELQHDAQRREGFQTGAAAKGLEATIYNQYSARINNAIQDGDKAEAARLRAARDALKMKGDFDTYTRLAGEAEARTVQKRMDMTPEERRARPPWLDYDVPEEQQIVRFADGSSVSQKSYSSEPSVQGFPTIKGNVMFAIRAFHGSPHDFDRFDLSKIGTGEGAQAYGHGLYFAENEGVAKSYRNALSGNTRYGRTDLKTAGVDGTPYDHTNPGHVAAYYAHRNGAKAAREYASEIEMTRKTFGQTPEQQARSDQILEMLKSGTVPKFQPDAFNGKLYEVRIKAEPEDFLDWDKPLSQQSEKVRSAIAASRLPDRLKTGLDDLTGEKFFTDMARGATATDNAIPNGPQRTYALKEAGIPGIRYLDQGSRTAGEGSSNYVVFDDKLIEIVAKDGKPIEAAERKSVIDGMMGGKEDGSQSGHMFAMADEPQSPLVAAIHDADQTLEIAAAFKLKPPADGQAMFALRDPGTIIAELESSKKIGKKEADEIRAKLAELQRGGMSLDEAIGAVASDLEASGQDKKRRALRMETVRQTIIDDLLKYRNHKGETDILEAWKRMHERFDVTGSFVQDVETAKDAIIIRAQMGMQNYLRDMRKGAVTGDLRRRYGQSKARLDNIVRELFGTATDDQSAKEFAAAWTAVSDELRQRFNAAGGSIGKLEKWGLPQSHDQLALLNAGRAPWVDYMMADGVLDRDRMINPLSKRRMTDGELRESLGVVWDRITTDGWTDKEISGVPMGRGALFSQHADHRFLHFKDANSWLRYAKDYGNPDPYAAMMGHIAMMARDIAHMERFGPNPNVMRTYVRNWLTQRAETLISTERVIAEQTAELKRLQGGLTQPNPEFETLTDRLSQVHNEIASIRMKNGAKLKGSFYSKRNKTKLEALQAEVLSLEEKLSPFWDGTKDMTLEDGVVAAQITALLDEMRTPVAFASKANPDDYLRITMNRVDAMWEQQRGALGMPVNQRWATGMTVARNIISSSSLGAAVFSSLSDPAYGQAQRQRWGMALGKSNAATVMKQTLARLASPEAKWEGLASGLALDAAMNVLHQQARMTGGIDMRTWSGYLADRTLSLGLLSPYTQAGKHAHGLMLQMWLGENSGKMWTALPPEVKNGLQAHGFDAASWNKIRQVPMYDPEAKAMATPESRVKQLRAPEIEATVGRELAEKYIAMIVRDTRMAIPEGTVESRSVVMGSTKPGTVSGEIVRAFGQFKAFPVAVVMLVMGQTARDLGAGKPGAALRAGSLLLTSTFLGALAMGLKDVKDGRDPKRWLDENHWLAWDMWGAAMLQSGGLGIYGDFFFSNVNRQGNGLAATLGGPMVDRADNLKNLTIGNVTQMLQGKDTNFAREALRFGRMNTPMGNLWFIGAAYQRAAIDQLQILMDPKANEQFRTQMLNRRRDYGGQEFFWRPGSPTPDRFPDISRIWATQ